MAHVHIEEIRKDIKIISEDVERCKDSLPRSIFQITEKMKDYLCADKINQNEYNGERAKISALVDRFNMRCTCSIFSIEKRIT